MKRIVIPVAVLAIFAASCKKDFKPEEGGVAVDAGTQGTQAIITLPQVISANMTLTTGNTYLMDGKVYVTNGAKLTIQKGVQLHGIYKKGPNTDAATAARNASALIITRSATIDCLGGQSGPDNAVVFTSDLTSKRDSLDNPTAPREPGDWGGVVILANGVTNKPSTQTIEGINPADVPPGVDVTYGNGPVPSQSIGRIYYTRIEYAGASIAANNELNSLTFGAATSTSTCRFVQCSKGADDAFEFFGGNLNAFFLIANSQNDDAFDFDFGYRGIVQFAVSVRGASFVYNDANGIESDNDNLGLCATPTTQATLSNLTIVGGSAALGGTLNGARFRRQSGLILRNSIIMGYNNGVSFENVNPATIPLAFRNNAVHGFVDSALFSGVACDGAPVSAVWGVNNLKLVGAMPPNNPAVGAWVNTPIPATLAGYKSGALAYKVGGPLDPAAGGLQPDYVGLSANVIRSADINYVGAIGQGGYVSPLDPGNWIAGSAATWVNFDPQ
jgi:hypothetical protein